MDSARITSDPRVRWGTPCLGNTAISVGHVVELHLSGYTTDQILERCPGLTDTDVDAALDSYDELGPEAVRPRPPAPGTDHERIVVDADIQGGLPVVRGTRVTVDCLLGLWEHDFTKDQILADYPSITAEDLDAAIAYDAEARVA